MVCCKNRNAGKSEGRPRGGAPYSYSKENEGWLQKGYGLFKNESGGYDRDFWIGQPLGPDNKGINSAPPRFGLVQIK